MDIADKSAQSITSRPLTEELVYVADGQTRYSDYYISEQTIKISTTTVSGMLHEIPVQFTDALYGAKIPDTAEFGKGQYFITRVDILDYSNAQNFMNVDILVETGPYHATEAETHKITGTISHDGIVSVLEEDEHTLIKQKSVTAGAFEVLVPERDWVDVITKRNSNDQILGVGRVAPIAQ